MQICSRDVMMYDKMGLPMFYERKTMDLRFTPEDILKTGCGFVDINIHGFTTSIYDLAKKGYSLRVSKKWVDNKYTKFSFHDGTNVFVMKVKDMVYTTDIKAIIDFLEIWYQREGCSYLALSAKTPVETTKFIHVEKSIKDYSEDELLQELERRVDAAPKRKKKKSTLPPNSNVISITEIIARLNAGEEILPRKTA
jgi:hypothetical protein